jgi:hypothetical protein
MQSQRPIYLAQKQVSELDGKTLGVVGAEHGSQREEQPDYGRAVIIVRLIVRIFLLIVGGIARRLRIHFHYRGKARRLRAAPD